MTRTLIDFCNQKRYNKSAVCPPPPNVSRRTKPSVPRRQPVTWPDQGLGLQKL